MKTRIILENWKHAPMVPNLDDYNINKWMVIVIGLALILSVTAFYLYDSPLDMKIPFYQQMDCESLGNLILDQGSFDEMLQYYENTCIDDISYRVIFGN